MAGIALIEMSIEKKIHNLLREGKMKANHSLALIAKVTHFIPEKQRQVVRDKLISLTTPGDLREYHAPVQNGRIIGRKGINLFGYLRARTGLAQGARSYASALEKTGLRYDLLNTDFIDWLEQDDHSLDEKIRKKGRYAINVVHINPDQWENACRMYPYKQFDQHYNIGVWLWELETLPRAWLPMLENVDELWVPSKFIADAVRKETQKPTTVIPYGIETPVDGSKRMDFGLDEREFLVLAMYDSRSHAMRKNPQGVIEAFSKAFQNYGENTRLVLKLANGPEKEIRELHDRLQGSGIKYHLVTESFDKPKLNALIACCDVFVSLHRSEGFGLVIAEAMSLGVPVIATGWSANVEFMPDDCTCKVDYTLVPVGDAYQWSEKSHRWADPDIDQAAGYLRMLYENPERARNMGAAAREYVHGKLSLEVCARKIRRRYEEIYDELAKAGFPPDGI